MTPPPSGVNRCVHASAVSYRIRNHGIPCHCAHCTPPQGLGVFLNCWTEERKNSDAKLCMQHNRSKDGFAGTALSRLLNAQLRRLDQQSWTSALLGSTQALGSLVVSPHVRHNGVFMGRDVLVFVNDETTLLAGVAGTSDAAGSQFGMLAHRCVLQHRRRTSSTWVIDAPVESFVFGKAAVFTPKCWRWTADGTLEVLH